MFVSFCFDDDTLTYCFLSELIDDKKETSNFFGKDFADAIMEGRNKESIHYMNLFYFFGDFFVLKVKRSERSLSTASSRESCWTISSL